MGLFRIALATPPFPLSLAHGLECVERFAREASERGARIVCFPESYLPGYRGIGEPVPPHSPGALRDAASTAREIARNAGIALVLPMDWPLETDERKVLNVAMVFSRDGSRLGHQTKNQLDPSEDETFTPGSERRLFEVDGVRFGIVICHEGFRYPESVRWAARRGAELVFHPHCTGGNQTGRALTEWRSAANPYYEQAMMCRALENTIFVAGVNYAFRYQESASSVFGPQGESLGFQPYGQAGVLVVELELDQATRKLADRFEASRYG